MDEFVFKEEADTYRQMHLEDAIAFIPYGCMVDEFQHIVYSNPDLTPDERHAAWKNWKKNTNHTLITREIHLWKKVVSGRNSFTFMTIRFIYRLCTGTDLCDAVQNLDG